ncbi:SSD domain-containing protein [Caenorhabditis elegans]|uniref:SSD domain-containing protein n=2 Tax=Caenorhabditis elegans TaxID=6239 RepID=A0A0K3ASC2_CAEEL|nr:SSD domain-containing protein [Caenorhabditis elegans]CTQ86901.1 SSD domain-containing protein [Caenorhabditis elegans]|eukprot:NP_001300202.1 PaTched Related family [Caenorhabditis elegans]
MKSPGAVISLYIRQFFRWTGLQVYRHPAPFFWIPVVLSLAAALGLLRFHEENRIWYLYSPEKADSHFEHAVANEFFNDRGGKFWLEVTITAKDMDNLLRRDYLDGVDSLAEYLQYNFTVPCSGVRGENKLECSFSDLCSGQCNDNQVIPLFNLIYRNASSRLHPNFRLTYPTMHLYNDEYYVGEHFAGVKIDPNTNVISRVKVVVLYFRTDRQTTEVSQVLNNWETSLFDYVENFDHPFLNMTVNSDAMIAREVRTNGMTCVPFFSFSVAAVVIFIFATNSREHFVFSHNVVMAILGIAGPLMATGTAFGFLFLFGFPFNSITLVMPFLIIGVGCDDVFIIIHAMRKTDKSESLEDRIAETMEEAGPSITVTSATNCLSFAIGIATPTPAISLFCLYTCVAVAVDFVYQLTFFVAVLVYEEKRLMKLQKVGEEKKIEAAMERRPKQVLSIQNSIRSTAGAHPPPANPNGIVSRYCRFLKDWKTRLCLLLVLCGYWTASYYGCKTMEIKMDTTNLIMNDSPLNHIAWIYERFLWSEGQLVMVFVNNPPDLTKSENLHEVLELVNRFETLPYSMGKNSTSIWLRSFLYQSSLYHNNKGFNGLLQEWLEDSEGGGARWNDMLRLKKDENGTILGIDKFMFATACAMGDDANWSTREKLQKQWRGVAHEYEHFNVTVFQSYSFYIDQLDSIGATTMSTVIWAAITMDLACLLMIPGINSILTSTIAMISINIGVFGLLSMWRVNLDPITMCTTLMSIGFSVDFTAHISYHYYRNPTSWTTDERLADALKSIGWPMIQAASSTVLCIFPLMFNTSYMVWVFVKTILLVTVLGLLHGIIFLPALLLTSGDLSRLFGGDSIQPEKPEKLGEISQASSFSSGNSETALVKSNSTELRTLPQERGSG